MFRARLRLKLIALENVIKKNQFFFEEILLKINRITLTNTNLIFHVCFFVFVEIEFAFFC